MSAAPFLPSQQIFTPTHVRAVSKNMVAPPDRYFYLLSGDTVWQCDGYRTGSAELPDDHPDVKWLINFNCPICHNNLSLDSTKKKLRVTPGQGLDTDELRCSYIAQFGGWCPFDAVLESPQRAGDKTVTVDGKKIKIDAVVKRC